MANSTTDVLNLLAAAPLPADCRALLMVAEEPANSNSVHAISLVIVEGEFIEYVSDSDTYIERSGRESRLVSTLERLFALGFKAPAVFVEKSQKIEHLSAGPRPVFICPNLSRLAATGRIADARYWPDMEAAYEAAYKLALDNHETAKAAGNIPK